jgi:hypothetical protein
MDPSTPNHAAQANMFPLSPQRAVYHAQGIHDSLCAIATANSPTYINSAITPAPDDSTSSTIAAAHPSCNPTDIRSPKITVYYFYNEDGTLRSTFTLDPLIHSYPGQTALQGYMQRGDIVGAYLAQREILFPAYATIEAYSQIYRGDQQMHEQQPVAYNAPRELCHQNEEPYDSYDSYRDDVPDQVYRAGYMGFALHTKPHRAYPDPDDIRHLHTLYSLLQCVDPGRRFNGFTGPTVDIVEEDMGTVYAYGVHKKMLVLFLGRKTVTKFLRTVESFTDDRTGQHRKIQKLYIPHGVTSTSAIKVLVSWMSRACRINFRDQVRQFQVPRNTFAACTLAQTLTMFGLHKDALRVDHTISAKHLVRPIFAVELATLWNCLGEKNRYVYAAIKAVGERLQIYGEGEHKKVAIHEEILELLEKYPALKTRVRDLSFNESYRPTFSTDWCKYLLEGSSQAKEPDTGYQTSSFVGNPHSRFLGGIDEPEQRIAEQTDKSAKSSRKVAVLRIVPTIQKLAASDDDCNLDENS